MSNTDLNTVRDDISYVRGLAEAGGKGPLLGGPVLIAAALIFGAANFGQYLLGTGAISADPYAPLWLWIGAGVLFAIALTLIIRRMDANGAARTTANQAVGAAWSGVGFGIFAVWLGLMAVGFSTGQWQIMVAMPIVVAAAYGTAWMVAGAMSKQRWLTGVGLLSYAGAVLVGLTAGTAMLYLVFTAFLIACALIPGVILTRMAAKGAR